MDMKLTGYGSANKKTKQSVIANQEEPQSCDEASVASVPPPFGHTQCHTSQTHLGLVNK